MKRFSVIILIGVSFIFAACKKTTADGKITEISANTDKKIQAISPAKPTVTPFEESPLVKNSNQCQPKNIQQDSEADEITAAPESRKEFDAWLNKIIGSVQVTTLANRKFINDYLWEGDLNNDGCRDVAILVEDVKDESGTSLTDKFVVGTTVQNLRSKAVYNGNDKKLDVSDALLRQIKPQQKTAVAVIFGGQKGWSWKSNAANREFLLYDAVFTPSETSGYEASSTLFGIIDKSKPEEDYDDLIDRFPANAVADCIYTATEVKRKKDEFSELSNKFLICYDGKIFFNKKLPDSKSYPER